MAVLSTSYDVESSIKTTLKNTISPTQTTNIQISTALTITSGVLVFNPGLSNEEFISFGGASVSNGVTTLSDVTRDLSTTANNFAGTGTGSQHSGGTTTVKLTNYHALYNQKANLDRANTFSADQTISGTNRIFLNDSDSYIYDNGTDIVLKSSAQSEVALATLANLSGINDKTKITVSDTTEGYLDSKVLAGDGLSKTTNNPASNETLTFALDLATNGGLEISGGELQIKAGSGITLDGEGINISPTTTQTAGETATSGDGASIQGDGRFYLSDGDDLNRTSTVVGTFNEGISGGADGGVNLFGPRVGISGLTATDGRFWLSHEQTSSNNSADVYGNFREGESFTTKPGQTRVDEIKVHMTETGTASGTMNCELYAVDGSGLPTGSALASDSTLATNLVDGLNTFTLNATGLTESTQYCFIVYNTTGNGSNHFNASYQDSDSISGGNRITSTDGGSSWSNEATHDLRFEITYNSVVGENLYLTDTAGGLDLSPGTYFQKVGTVISDSEAMLNLGEPFIYATYSFADSGVDVTVDTELEIGFRAKAVIAMGDFTATEGGTSGWGSIGFWGHGQTGGASMGALQAFNSALTGNFHDPSGLLNAYGGDSGSSGNTKLTVHEVTANTITIRRDMNDDSNNAPGATVYLLIFG